MFQKPRASWPSDQSQCLQCCKELDSKRVQKRQGGGLVSNAIIERFGESEPLSSRRVSFRSDEELDEANVIAALRTMALLKLVEVKFDPAQEQSVIIKELLCDLRAGKHQQAIEQSTLRSSCSDPAMEKGEQLAPSVRGFPRTCCMMCHKQCCRSGACLAGLLGCEHCGARLPLWSALSSFSAR